MISAPLFNSQYNQDFAVAVSYLHSKFPETSHGILPIFWWAHRDQVFPVHCQHQHLDIWHNSAPSVLPMQPWSSPLVSTFLKLFEDSRRIMITKVGLCIALLGSKDVHIGSPKILSSKASNRKFDVPKGLHANDLYVKFNAGSRLPRLHRFFCQRFGIRYSEYNTPNAYHQRVHLINCIAHLSGILNT